MTRWIYPVDISEPITPEGLAEALEELAKECRHLPKNAKGQRVECITVRLEERDYSAKRAMYLEAYLAPRKACHNCQEAPCACDDESHRRAIRDGFTGPDVEEQREINARISSAGSIA